MKDTNPKVLSEALQIYRKKFPEDKTPDMFELDAIIQELEDKAKKKKGKK